MFLGFDWNQAIGTAIVTATPIALYMAANRHNAKAEIEKKHEENIQKWNELLAERRYLLPHDHNEKSGPLTFDGIRRAER